MIVMRAAFNDDIPRRDEALEVQRLCRGQGVILSLHDAHAVWTAWDASVFPNMPYFSTDDGLERPRPKPFPTDPSEIQAVIDRFCVPLL